MIPIKYENIVNILYSMAVPLFFIIQLNRLFDNILLYPIFILLFIVGTEYIYQLTQETA